MKQSLFLKLGTVVASAALVLTAAGCSGGAAEGSESPSTSADGAATSDAPADDAGTFAKDSDTLIMGMVPDEGAAGTTYQPLADYIAEITGKTVEVKESTDYAALIEAAVAGQLDVASFSGFTYLQAQAKGADITPISATDQENEGKPGYYSTAIVPKDSPITSIAEFKGKKVCFVNQNSTSGFLFPNYMLSQEGISLDDITPVYAGAHDVSAQKVAQGTECEVGFAQETTVTQTGPAAGLFKADDLKIIHKEMVPGPPFVYNNALPQDVKDVLTEKMATVTIDDIKAAGVTVNDAFVEFWGGGNMPVDDKYYDGLRDLCGSLPDVETCEGI